MISKIKIAQSAKKRNKMLNSKRGMSILVLGILFLFAMGTLYIMATMTYNKMNFKAFAGEDALNLSTLQYSSYSHLFFSERSAKDFFAVDHTAEFAEHIKNDHKFQIRGRGTTTFIQVENATNQRYQMLEESYYAYLQNAFNAQIKKDLPLYAASQKSTIQFYSKKIRNDSFINQAAIGSAEQQLFYLLFQPNMIYGFASQKHSICNDQDCYYYSPSFTVENYVDDFEEELHLVKEIRTQAEALKLQGISEAEIQQRLSSIKGISTDGRLYIEKDSELVRILWTGKLPLIIEFIPGHRA